LAEKSSGTKATVPAADYRELRDIEDLKLAIGSRVAMFGNPFMDIQCGTAVIADILKPLT
jgi:hypothetical protein